jgi:hypothetical protein
MCIVHSGVLSHTVTAGYSMNLLNLLNQSAGIMWLLVFGAWAIGVAVWALISWLSKS